MKMPETIVNLLKELEEAAKTEDGPRARMSRRAARLIRGLYDEQIPISESSVDSH